ncbi:hypothetical protein ANCCEY_07868 [Ancylostoma ceylanicum]|uniref:Fucosyltransferase n=1 Tax=Ancylostoma ceylanicum TaxID=53326 RepID=A0A0D6LPB4_9BILA|nr:hypothetical protein ANCCEY_07868 [Ancylostoma ceylanicum]
MRRDTRIQTRHNLVKVKVAPDYFNATISYRRDSHYYHPYGQLPPLQPGVPDEDVVTEEQRSFTVHGDNRRRQLREQVEDYVWFKCFILITLNLHRRRTHSQNFEDAGLPPDSFIALDDFATVQELAQYLNRLRNDDSAYLRLILRMDEVFCEAHIL